MATNKQETSLDILASLHGINRALRRRASAALGDSLGVMMVLSAVAAPGRARASDLAEQLLVDLSSISRRLSTLESRGLIEKVVDTHDRRAQLVALTPAGHEALSELRRTSGERMAETLAGWNADDLETLAGLLLRLDATLNSPAPETTSTRLTASTK